MNRDATIRGPDTSGNEQRHKAKSFALSCLLSSAILAIYLLFPTKNYFLDGIKFAQSIEDSPSLGPSLIDPNHLIYRAAGYLVYRVLLGSGLRVRALAVLQFTNSILAVVTAFLLFHLLRSRLGSRDLACVLTLLFALSATWWKFSTDANCYVPSILFLVACFYLVLPTRRARPLRAAATHTMAILSHQLAVFFFPVAMLGLFYQTSANSRRRRLFNLLAYALFVAVLTYTAYLYGFYVTHGTLDFHSFMRWVTTRSADASFSFSPWNNFLYTLRGHVRLFLGGRVAFALAAAKIFTVISIVVLLALLTALCVILLRETTSVRDVWAQALKPAPQFRPLTWLAVTWIATYAVFLFFWLPHNAFYRLFYLPAIILLLGIFLRLGEAAATRKLRLGFLVSVAIVALSNFSFLVLPYTTLTANPSLRFALRMNRTWNQATVIYYANFNPDNWLIRYFNPVTRWQFLVSDDLEKIEENVEKIYKDGGTAWLETTATDALMSRHPNCQAWLDEHTQGQHRHELIYPGYRIRFVQVFPKLGCTSYSSGDKTP